MIARMISTVRPAADSASGPLITMPLVGSATAGVWLAVAAMPPTWVVTVGVGVGTKLVVARDGLGRGLSEMEDAPVGDVSVVVAVTVAVTVTVGTGEGVGVGLGRGGSTTVALAVAGLASRPVATSVMLRTAPGVDRRIATRIRSQTACRDGSRRSLHTALLAAGQ